MRLVPALGLTLALAVPAGADDPVDFNQQVKPILAKNCFACHGPDEAHRSAKLRLDRRDDAIKARKRGAAVVPGKPDESLLVERILAEDESERMPPRETGNVLTAAQKSILKRWIAEGAQYAEHWAFVKPRRPEAPAVTDRGWPRNPVDRFILARLEKEGLKPNPEADQFALLRRASLDLRGLPPTPQEIEAFERDTSPEAYERMVERFQNDSAFGERWARMWLDLARYADSAGYGSDPLRPNMWRYRDWVIEAFNKNLPYDRFTVEQIAGDLLPGATVEQRMATAFHRNTMTNTEGGTDDEEFRVAAVKDRVDTTLLVWMGLTMGCAKCHDHKFDPITQKEYYRFFAFFNQSADADRGDEAPVMPVPTAEVDGRLKQIEARIAALKTRLAQPSPALDREQTQWEAGLRPASPGEPLDPVSFRSEKSGPLTRQPDRSLRPSKPVGETDVFTVTVAADGKPITGFRLDLLPDVSRPDGARVAGVSVSAGAEGKAPVGRFVRVELPGDGRMLSLAEVQVFRNGQNVAPKGKATQSSTAFEGPAHLAIDGNTNGNYNEARSVTHTNAEKDPWWLVELPDSGPVERVVIWNRTDGGLGSRLSNFKVSLLDEKRNAVWQQQVAEPPSPNRELTLGGPQAVVLADAFGDLSPRGGMTANGPNSGHAGQGGWSVAAAPREAHWLTLVCDKPLALPAGTPLTFRIDHQQLGSFRLSAIHEPALAQRLTVPPAVRAVIDTQPEARTPAQRQTVADYYRGVAPGLKALRDEFAALEKSRPEIPTLPVMQELPATQRRKTHVMIKGNFLDRGEEVGPGTPAGLFPFPKGAPLDRLGVARWLVSPENPLTARVAVNRFWAQLFGKGLVETEEDFGTQGELPSHPELLDWLATEYVRLGWDTKALLKLMVTSATYRQSSRVTPELLKADPKNHLYSRAPRFRLEAEMVRDQALALSGLLSRKVGGPSVYPPQPAGLWQAAFNGQRTWPTSSGDDRYRRGLYTFWRRTIPYPSMTAFDAPSRETCAIKRVRTNTPLQAFVTLNDPVYVEAAQALARRMVRDGGATPEQRAAYGLRLCLCRIPQPEQVRALAELYASELARFGKDAKAAKAMATDPAGPVPQGMSEPQLAAWTVVANVLLNLDGVLTKG